MRKLMICLAGAAMLMLTPTLSNAAPARLDSAPAVQKPVEQARMVRRCRVARVWRNGPHGRRLVSHRVCRMVNVR